MNVQNRSTAVITGAGSGIGEAIAAKFLKEGWRVIALGRRLEKLQALKRFAENSQVLALTCDVASGKSVEEAVKLALANKDFSSSIRAVINNAGIVERKSFAESDDALWESMLQTNLLGAVRITRAFLPALKAAKGAAIINIASNLGLRPIADTSAYSASKAAMLNWTQSLALELAPFGIRANSVSPGIVDTPIHHFHTQSKEEKAPLGKLQPLGRLGEPHDVAHACWALAASGSEWITGANLTVDGGISLQ